MKGGDQLRLARAARAAASPTPRNLARRLEQRLDVLATTHRAAAEPRNLAILVRSRVNDES